MAEPGKVKALRALFDKGTTVKPQNPVDYEKTRASVARHNLKYAARRASRIAATANTQDSGAQRPKPIVPYADKKAEWMTFGESTAFWLPELDTAVANDDSEGINKAVLTCFFEEHDPKRLGEVEKILEENKGREEELFTELSVQYPEPSIGVVFELVEAEKKLEEDKSWANFDDEEKPIVNGMRRPTGVWAVNYSPWGPDA